MIKLMMASDFAITHADQRQIFVKNTEKCFRNQFLRRYLDERLPHACPK